MILDSKFAIAWPKRMHNENRRQIRKRPGFVIDVVEIAVYLGEQTGEMISERFVDAVDSTMDTLADMPGIGPLRDFNAPSLPGLRSWQVEGYRSYLMFYVHSDQTIDFVRVIHGSRDLHAIFDEQ